jgi:hypothetical protein
MQYYDDRLHTLVENGFNTDGLPTFVVGIDVVMGDFTCENTPLFFCPDPYALSTTPDQTALSASEIETWVQLNDLADKGGRPKMGQEKFYNATDPMALQTELEAIIQGLQSCVIPLNADPPPPMFGSVEVEAPAGTMWNEVTDCMTQDGWVFVDPACVTNATDPDCLIELCGAACDALRMTGSADIKYICGVG